MLAVTTFALELLRWAPTAIQGVQSAAELLRWGTSLVEQMVKEGRDPTIEEIEELDSRIAKLRGELHTD